MQTIRDEIRSEVRSEFKREARARRIRGCVGWLVFYLLLLGIPVVLLAAMAAKSGFVDVPVLSKRMYKPVAAVRIVEPYVGADSQTVMKEVVASMDYSQMTGYATATISEKQLTTIVDESLSSVGSGFPVAMSKAQTVITRDWIELSFLAEREGRIVPVVIRFKPITEAGEVKMDVQDVTVGSLALPNIAKKALANLVQSSVIDAVIAKLPAGVSLVDVSLTENSEVMMKLLMQ